MSISIDDTIHWMEKIEEPPDPMDDLATGRRVVMAIMMDGWATPSIKMRCREWLEAANKLLYASSAASPPAEEFSRHLERKLQEVVEEANMTPRSWPIARPGPRAELSDDSHWWTEGNMNVAMRSWPIARPCPPAEPVKPIPFAPGDHVMLRLSPVEEQRCVVTATGAEGWVFVKVDESHATGRRITDMGLLRKADPVEPKPQRYTPPARKRLKPGCTL